MFRKKEDKRKEKIKNKDKWKEGKWIKSILIPGSKIPFLERVIKFLIYIALRLVIRPSRWKDTDKNFRIINYTYKKVTSADLIFIPSSLSFYIVMSFIPILSLITFILTIPGLEEIRVVVNGMLSNFMPGMKTLLSDLSLVKWNNTAFAGLMILLFISIWISSIGFSKLIYTQSHIFNFYDTGTYWRNRFRGIFIVVILTCFITGALILTAIFNIYVLNQIQNDTLKMIISGIAKFFFLFFSIILLFIFLFKLTPTFRVKLKNIIPGAFVAGIPTFLFFSLFGYFISLLSYSNYGAVAVIMYLGASSIVVSNFTFMGITANAAFNTEFVEGEIISKKINIISKYKEEDSKDKNMIFNSKLKKETFRKNKKNKK